MPKRPFAWPRKGTTRTQAGIREGFRSGLEDTIAADLEARGVPVVFEQGKLKYVIPASVHTYTWDFRLPNGILVESKGRFLSEDRAKHLWVRTQYPALDIRFVFQTPTAKISPGSSTTLAMWADKHGYPWAKASIPASWIAEPGPARPPEEVIKEGPLGYRDFEAPKRRRA